jgi:hypothetical protein
MYGGTRKHGAMKSSILVAAILLCQELALPQAPTPQASSSLSYEYFRDRVQPIFLAKRPGHARCLVCHENGTPRLQELSPGSTTWNEEQSRKNFDAWKRVVNINNPMASRLLLHPLAPDAGGDPFHAGGKHFKSKDDPEWQVLAGWVRTAAPQTAVTLDYAFFRDRVQPIFLNKRPGHARCLVCHENGSPRLQELSPGATAWNEEQSRKNFDAWKRVVNVNNPSASRLLMHPLAPEGGGDAFHAGGKHWKSQSDPEWQTLAAWARGEVEK